MQPSLIKMKQEMEQRARSQCRTGMQIYIIKWSGCFRSHCVDQCQSEECTTGEGEKNVFFRGRKVETRV